MDLFEKNACLAYGFLILVSIMIYLIDKVRDA